LFGSLCKLTHARSQLVSIPVPPPPLPLPPLLLLLLSPAPVSPRLPASLAPVPVSMAMPVSMVPVSPPLPSLPPPSLTRTSPLASPVPPLPLFLTRPHVVVHWPKRQTSGGEHFLPQVPQLFGSDVTSVHTWSLPQKVLVGQVGAPSL
jgi:hypothetical protein